MRIDNEKPYIFDVTNIKQANIAATCSNKGHIHSVSLSYHTVPTKTENCTNDNGKGRGDV
jgi:hypothetical protein